MSANSSISTSKPQKIIARDSLVFVLVTFCTCLLLLFTTAALNWEIDPFDKLGHNKIGVYSSSEREAKPQMVLSYSHDALITGTSRMTYVDPVTIKGYRFFNAGFSAATPEEILDFLRVYAWDQRIVILGLDFLMFNESYLPLSADPFKTVTPPLLSGKPLTYAELKVIGDYILSWNVTWNSGKALIESLFEISPPFLMPAGNRNARLKLAEDASVHDFDEGELIEYWRTNTLHNFRYSIARLAVLKEIKKLLFNRHIQLVVLITPDNSSYIALIHELGLYPSYLTFRRDISNIFPDAFDFSESKWSGIDYRFKDDTGHFLPEAGAEMMTAVLSATTDGARDHK